MSFLRCTRGYTNPLIRAATVRTTITWISDLRIIVVAIAPRISLCERIFISGVNIEVLVNSILGTFPFYEHVRMGIKRVDICFSPVVGILYCTVRAFNMHDARTCF